MKRVQVFDPPMCCSTGVCGPSADPALARGAVVSKGCYPTRDELARLIGVEPEPPSQAQIGATLPVLNTKCC